MAAVTCLVCNGCAATHDRRLLSSCQSSQVRAAWKAILTMKVEADERLATTVERVAAAGAVGYLCRKCFSLLDRYQKLKVSLLTRIDSVISSFNQQTVSKRTAREDDDDVHVPTAKVRRLSENIARRQLNFSEVDNQSPSVVVGIH